MPQTIIREFDETASTNSSYSNFTVVVPGFIGTVDAELAETYSSIKEAGDADGIYEISTINAFKGIVGYCPAKTFTSGTGESAVTYPAQYGNQIAYELVKAGYTVLYVSLGTLPTGETAATTYKTALDKLKVLPTADGSIWAPLLDRSVYDFRYVISGLFTDKTADYAYNVDLAMGTLVSFINDDNDNTNEGHVGRGDCIALIDIPEDIFENDFTQKNAISKITTYINDTETFSKDGNVVLEKYVAICTPKVTYNMSASDCKISIKTTKEAESSTNYWYTRDGAETTTEPTTEDLSRSFGATLHYLLCAAYSRRHNYDEWYANAGEKRGICKYTVLATSVRFGEVGVNQLQPRYDDQFPTTLKKSVNPVGFYRGTYYFMGNRTAYPIQDSDTNLMASHFLNIRELCTTLKKVSYEGSTIYRWDPNSSLLWLQYCNYIRPTLDLMKANQGIDAYDFVQVSTSKKAKIRGKIVITPIEAVEDFDLGVYLTNDISDGVNADVIED